MSEYRRVVSYLYSYDNGLKNKNVGFAKTERKNGNVRLWVNLKGAFAPEDNYRVYFFVRRDEALAGIDMGNVVIRGGTGDFAAARRENDLGVNFDELCGLYIRGNSAGKVFASQWDDRSFDVEKFVQLSELSPEKASDETAPKNDLPEPSEDTEKEKTEELPIWQRPIKEMYIDEGSTAAEISVDEEGKEQSMRATESKEEPLHAAEAIPVVDSTARDMLFDGKEPVMAFCEDEIYDCVDIGLDELSRLPAEAESLKSNSFVNHGYYNFHHLLLGKKDGNVLVVGVPGIYNRREKMTANMFGFEKFKFSMRGDVRMNHFGYWYREYQCS